MSAKHLTAFDLTPFAIDKTRTLRISERGIRIGHHTKDNNLAGGKRVAAQLLDAAVERADAAVEGAVRAELELYAAADELKVEFSVLTDRVNDAVEFELALDQKLQP
jgi:hypothetical protein